MYEWFVDAEEKDQPEMGGGAGNLKDTTFENSMLKTQWNVPLTNNENGLRVGSSRTLTLGGGWTVSDENAVTIADKTLFTGAVPVYQEILSGAVVLAMGSLAVLATITL